MLYNDFHGLKLSALGMGCMRFPCIEGSDKVDMDATRKMIAYSMEKGINYYDTAWGYHGGESEPIMGEILSAYPRDSYYLATKFPGYDVRNFGKVEEIFEEQLVRCKVDYFDFYLFHNVCETNIDKYLNPEYRTFEYLIEQKKNGRIRHLGFSLHGTLETTKRFLDAYGEHLEFCQIQLNWLDYDFQKAKEKVTLLNSLNIPIWVMEPVRGGKLCQLEPQHEEKLRALRPEYKNPEWAFRFLQGIEGVTVVLSGMSNLTQLAENIATFSERRPLSDNERETLLGIAKEMTSKGTLPCTSCRYCVDHCPQALNIPRIIEIYNEYVYSKGGFLAAIGIRALDENKRPAACIGCRSCEEVCPQNLKISEMMHTFSENLKKK